MWFEKDFFVKEAGNGTLFLYLTEGNWGQIKSAGFQFLFFFSFLSFFFLNFLLFQN